MRKKKEEIDILQILIESDDIDEEVRKNLIAHQQMRKEVEKHNKRMKQFAGFLLAYIILIFASLFVVLFVAPLKHYAETFLAISNFISIGLCISNIVRIYKHKLQKHSFGKMVILASLLAMVLCGSSMMIDLWLYLI